MKRRDDGKTIGTTLEKIADAVVAKALEGDKDAYKEIAERHDGKVPQAIIGDSEEDPINLVQRIERVIVDPNTAASSGEGVHPASGTE